MTLAHKLRTTSFTVQSTRSLFVDVVDSKTRAKPEREMGTLLTMLTYVFDSLKDVPKCPNVMDVPRLANPIILLKIVRQDCKLCPGAGQNLRQQRGAR